MTRIINMDGMIFNLEEYFMASIRYLGIGLAALVFMGGCESTPTVTRTGDVKDVIIGDDLSAAEISVNPGDEVRWINQPKDVMQEQFGWMEVAGRHY
jgi:hypothetical protein